MGVCMTEPQPLLLGYEAPSGEPVYMLNHHTVVTGMTQLSGKTTALEAMIDRARTPAGGNVKAVAFLTKRGEGGFRRQRFIQPYFKEQKKGALIDWQYVAAILEAVMGERMKLERSFIINACKGARSLQQVYENIQEMKDKTNRGFDESIYTNLGAYFEIILPQIKAYEFANDLNLSPGINVLDLIQMSNEMQQLVIESVLSYVYANEEDTVVIIPEAHKFIPQGIKTPVKATALILVKEGAALRNYMWIDTQETTSVDKAFLKQCGNWIMGYQQEKNEVKNVRENIGKNNITEEDIMTLKLGHFIVSLLQEIHHVYILPVGIPEEIGVEVAKGLRSVEDVKEMLRKTTPEEPTVIQLGTGPPYIAETYAPEEDANLRRLVPEYEMYFNEEIWRAHCATLETDKRLLQANYDELLTVFNALEVDHESLLIDSEKNQEEYLELQVFNDQMYSRLERLEELEAALKILFKPPAPAVDEEALEKMVDEMVTKKINALPTKTRSKIVSSETGIPWIDLWLPKLNKMETTIVMCLAEKMGTPLTKDQIALYTRYSAKGGSFNSAMSALKNRYKLILQEGNTYIIKESP